MNDAAASSEAFDRSVVGNVMGLGNTNEASGLPQALMDF
jgi:hypothetical protein